MGRSFKQRKLKKTKRVKVRSKVGTSKAIQKKAKSKMKTWEYFLFGGALIVAALAVIWLAQTGNITQDIAPEPTATAVSETQTQ